MDKNLAFKLFLTIFSMASISLFGTGLFGTFMGCNPDISNCYNRIKSGTLKEIWNINCDNSYYFNLLFFNYDNNECSYDKDGFTDFNLQYKICNSRDINETNDGNVMYKINENYNILVLDDYVCTDDLYYTYHTWKIGIILTSVGAFLTIISLILIFLRFYKFKNNKPFIQI